MLVLNEDVTPRGMSPSGIHIVDKTGHCSLARQCTDYSGVWTFFTGGCRWDHDSSSGEGLGWEINGLVWVRADALDTGGGVGS